MSEPSRRTTTRQSCVARDATDPLAPFRERFVLPEGVIYLDGNSLGALPRATAARVAQVVEEEWGQHLITSWNRHGWIDLAQRIGDKLGRLIGAAPGEAIIADSTSVNLYKTLSGAVALRPDRRVILSEVGNFPTDLYIAEGLIEQLGRGHELRTVTADDVPDALDDDVAVAMLTHVNYRTGRMYDMAATTDLAHRRGALMLWDLAHSAGAVPVDLAAANADLAVGCGYKYLNGGPGAPAFLYVAQRLQDSFRQPLSGWLGHAAPFAFDPHYQPAEGIRRGVVGTPPVISLAALEVGIDLMLEVDGTALRAKSLALGDLFIALVEQECAEFGFEMVSPRDHALRGSQASLVHRQGYAIMQALIDRGVIGDFRAPDILRFGFTPLYLGYAEIWDAVQILKDVMTTGAWDHPDFHRRAAVT